MQDPNISSLSNPLIPKENLTGALNPHIYGPAEEDPNIPVRGTRPQISFFKGQIILNPTISKINFAALIIFNIYISLILIPINLLQFPLLTIFFGQSNTQAINTATILEIAQLVADLIFYSVLGGLCDRYGRKIFFIIGVVVMCLSILVTPNLPKVYPYYLIEQVIQDLGMICMLTPPLIADYIDYETKGRVAALIQVLLALAGYVGSAFTENIDLQNNIPSEHHYIAIGGLVVGLVISLGIKGGMYHKHLFHDTKAEEAKKKAAEMIKKEQKKNSIENGESQFYQDYSNIDLLAVDSHDEINHSSNSNNNSQVEEKPGLMAGLREAKRNPWILIGYIAGFLFYSQTMLMTTVIVTFCNNCDGR